MHRAAAFLLVLVTLVPPARAEDAPKKQPGSLSTYEEADQAVAAFEAGDQDKLKALAARGAPDPWIVADLLCSRGEYEAARAFAEAAPRPSIAGLPRYVASRVGKSEDKSARDAHNVALTLVGAGKYQEALEAIEQYDGDVHTVVASA